MQAPQIPTNERQRLATLASLNVLDTPQEERFDRVTRLAQRLFDVPIVLVSLVDEGRQWFKSRQGLGADETPRDISFCGHAILDDEVLVVPDACEDARFAENPLVTGDPSIRFYAGVPLEAPDGHKLGTLCLIDRKARELSNEESAVLTDLGKLVERELTVGLSATRDPTTGLLNRRGFVGVGSKAFAICQRLEQPMVLAYLHLEGLAAIHLDHSVSASDRALWEFAEHLREVFGPADVVARFESDEFVALIAGEQDASLALAALQTRIDARNGDPLEPFQLRFTASATPLDLDRHRTLGDLVDDAYAALTAPPALQAQ